MMWAAIKMATTHREQGDCTASQAILEQELHKEEQRIGGDLTSASYLLSLPPPDKKVLVILHYQIGLTCFEKGEETYGESETHLKTVLLLNPWDFLSRAVLSDLYIGERRFREAGDVLTTNGELQTWGPRQKHMVERSLVKLNRHEAGWAEVNRDQSLADIHLEAAHTASYRLCEEDYGSARNHAERLITAALIKDHKTALESTVAFRNLWPKPTPATEKVEEFYTLYRQQGHQPARDFMLRSNL